jgi:hypothetical protein
MLTSWSLSRLHDYEKCPQIIKLKLIDKIPEPQNQWAERGTRVHGDTEAFVRGDLKAQTEDMRHFTPEFNSLRNLYAQGKVSIEGEWAHNNQWKVTDWRAKDTWLRLKLDASVRLSKTHSVVIDHKTGKLFGNEIKHAEQGQLYAGSTFIRYPELTKVTVEFWYLDKNELTHVEYSPQQAAKFVMGFERRANRMLNDKQFAARPSIFSCKYCAFRPVDAGGNGACKFGIGNIAQPMKRKW